MIRKILLLIDGTLLFLSVLLSIGYTYYIANVKYVDYTETVILSDIINLKADDNNEIIISNINPGCTFEKNFKVENLSDKDTTFNLLFNDIYNDYENDLVYELYEDEKLVVSQTIAPKNSENSYIKLNVNIEKATTKNYKLKFILLNRYNKNEEEFQNKKFTSKIEINSLTINSEIKTATNYILANNTVYEDENLDLSGLFKTAQTNNSLETYYFKGNVENNYVLINNELWRIIRINENGSIRIIKDSNLGVNLEFNSDSKLENSYNYLNSSIKNELEKYYNENLVNYDSLISEENYCNELHVVKNDNFKIDESNLSYTDYISTYKCNLENNLKIGLITYEEAIKAGLYYNNYNKSNYLTNGINKNTWSISPAGINNYTNDNYVWKVLDNGSVIESLVTNQYTSIRPVINLKGTLNITGDGSINNPYIFIE